MIRKCVVTFVVLVGVGLIGATTIAAAQTAPAPKGAAVKPASPAITLTTKPSPPKTGDNDFTVTVKDSKGQPISGADVSVTFVMPAMPMMKMAEMRNEVKLKPAAAGTYQGKGQVMMAGTWNVTISVKQAGKQIATKTLKLTAK
jgi:hypothetical protein